MLTLLVIDDNQMLADFTVAHVKTAFPELRVLVAYGPREVRLVMGAEKSDLVLLDWRLPGCDSAAFLQELRDLAPQAHFIVMSAERPSPMILAPFGTAIIGTLDKPYETEELLEMIRYGLKLAGFSDKKREARAEAPVKDLQKNTRHRTRNHLAGLLVGLRAFSADLLASADDPDEVRNLVEQYTPRLVGLVKDLTSMMGSPGEE